MKIWVTFCIAFLACAQIALGDGTSASPAPGSQQKTLQSAWPTSQSVVRRLKENGVPNFGKLNDYIWRSGQPTREGYQLLAARGLKTVVNLRQEYPQDTDLLPQGVKYVYISIKDEDVPTDEQAHQFIQTAANPDNWPLLVHCHGGEGRAGIMSALIRHSFDGWDHDKIMDEVSNFRIKRLGFIKVSMPESQRRFIQHWQETPNLLER